MSGISGSDRPPAPPTRCIQRQLAPGLCYRAHITGEPTPELIEALDAVAQAAAGLIPEEGER